MQARKRDTGGQRGQTGAAASLNAGSGFHESGNGGSTGDSTGNGTHGIGDQRFFHFRHFAVFVHHTGAGSGTYKGADGIKHIDHAEGDNQGDDRKPADREKALKSNLNRVVAAMSAKGGTKEAVAREANGLLPRKIASPAQ